MSEPARRRPETARALIGAVPPLMTGVLVSAMAIGLAMPVRPGLGREGFRFPPASNPQHGDGKAAR